MVWFLWKKTWNMGGWGMKNLLYTNLFDISNFFCLDCVWESFQRAGFQEDVHRPDEEQFLHQPFGHRRVTVQEISCHSFGIYYFFCRLQDIQGLGTCFIWVADFFFWGGKTSQTLRESHASKLLLFCRTQRDGHQPSRTRREWPERAGRQLLTWAATFSSTGMRHVQQLGSPARCFFFFFLPPCAGSVE